jgi:hypothetical protein
MLFKVKRNILFILLFILENMGEIRGENKKYGSRKAGF